MTACVSFALTRFNMTNYPDLPQYASQEAALDYLEDCYWPSGPVCPRCTSTSHGGTGREKRCSACGALYKVTTDTVFHGARSDIRSWILAVAVLVQSGGDISARKLGEAAGFSRDAAWRVTRKVRAAWPNESVPLARVAGVDPGEARLVKVPAPRSALAPVVTEGQVRIAEHGSDDTPLVIGGIEIPCYVLDDGCRVLAEAGLVSGLGTTRGTTGGRGGGRMVAFATGKNIAPYVTEELLQKLRGPVLFRAPNGHIAHGYDATILADICEAVLAARADKALQHHQLHIAHRCEVLLRGFARVGIIALVDEVTGYQEYRNREELHRILEAYVSSELLPWAKRFPNSFYQEMFRLRGWRYNPLTTKRPSYVGTLTNEIVYQRLPDGVLDELKKANPSTNGRRKHKHHQFLTADVGHPHLERHLTGVIALMRASGNWRQFERLLKRAYPIPGDQTELALDEQEA